MSKKSRRRNRRLLMLAALAGGAALAGRGKKKFGTDAGFLKSGAAGGARLSSPPILGTDHITRPIKGTEYPGANKVVSRTGDTGNTITRTSGITTSPTGQKIGAGGLQDGLSRGERAAIMAAKANAPKSIVRPGNYTPPVHPRIPRGLAYGQQMFKKGGSVKKAKVTGIAKRGFGRALGRGKK